MNFLTIAALDFGILLQSASSFVGAGAQYQFKPITDQDFWIGPRASYMRSELGAGLEFDQWFFNAVGTGIAFENVFKPSSRLRTSFVLQLHTLHVGEWGALGLRVAPLYDWRYQWGGYFALTLQTLQ